MKWLSCFWTCPIELSSSNNVVGLFSSSEFCLASTINIMQDDSQASTETKDFSDAATACQFTTSMDPIRGLPRSCCQHITSFLIGDVRLLAEWADRCKRKAAESVALYRSSSMWRRLVLSSLVTLLERHIWHKETALRVTAYITGKVEMCWTDTYRQRAASIAPLHRVSATWNSLVKGWPVWLNWKPEYNCKKLQSYLQKLKSLLDDDVNPILCRWK